MEFIYFGVEEFYNDVTFFGISFCGGFMIAVALHFMAYAVFGAVSLINIKN